MTDLPIIARFAGARSLPHVELGAWPTPVGAAPDLAERLGLESLWIKRDDVSSDAYGGNKVRKLEFLLAEARNHGCSAVITFGAYGSNHVLATAVHGARLGMDVHAVLMPQPVTSYLRANLLADLAVGATLHPAESFDDALRVAATVRAELRRAGNQVAVIPFGGTNALGTIGFVNAAFELLGQVESGLLPLPDRIYVPMGSMGTAAGLALGLSAAGAATRVQAVRVVPAAPDDPDAIERTLAEAIAALRDAEPAFPDLSPADVALDVREEFLGDGYARPTPAGVRAVALAAECGIGLETTYTGKALSAVAADAAAGRLSGANVVFWNTYNSRPTAKGDPSCMPPPFAGLVSD